MRATTEPLEDNVVRLSVEIDEEEVEKALDDVVRSLARQARVPGFRPGKVPRRLLEVRMGGADALRAEALREALPDFYARAVVDAEMEPIAPPEIDIVAGEQAGPVSFDARVQVRPAVAIPGYGGLQVTVPRLAISDEDVDAQLDRLREFEGELVDVDRPVQEGDYVTLDVVAQDNEGQTLIDATDTVYPLGQRSLGPEIDEALVGMSPGEVRELTAPIPGGDGERTAEFRIAVKGVQERRLPEVTDEWAAESSEFPTVAELRQDIENRLARARRDEARYVFRMQTVTALADLVDDEKVPAVMVEDRLHDEVHKMEERLSAQKLTFSDFLEASGITAQEFVAQLREAARRDVKVDLALRSLAEAEGIEADPADLEGALSGLAGVGGDVEAVRTRLEQSGGILAVRWQLRKDKALAWLLDNTQVVDEDGVPLDRAAFEADEVGDGGTPGEGGVGGPGTEGGARRAGAQGQEVTGTLEGAAVTEEVG